MHYAIANILADSAKNDPHNVKLFIGIAFVGTIVALLAWATTR